MKIAKYIVLFKKEGFFNDMFLNKNIVQQYFTKINLSLSLRY